MTIGMDAAALMGVPEVKPELGVATPEGASHSGLPSASPGEIDQPTDDRRELNVVKETLKRVARLEDSIGVLTNALLVQQTNGNGRQPQAPAAPEKPPHTNDEISLLFQNNQTTEAMAAINENVAWHSERAANVGALRADQAQQRRQLGEFLLREIGLADVNSAWGRDVVQLASEIRTAYPEMDDRTARVVASATLGNRMRLGKYGRTDLRTDTVIATGGAPPTRPAGPTPAKFDHKATNRGLSAEVVRSVKMFSPDLLQVSGDPDIERARQEAVETLVHELNGGGDGGAQ